MTDTRRGFLGISSHRVKCYRSQMRMWIKKNMGLLVGLVVELLPLAQVVILGSWDRVLNQAPNREPASSSAYVFAPLSVSLMNK